MVPYGVLDQQLYKSNMLRIWWKQVWNTSANWTDWASLENEDNVPNDTKSQLSCAIDNWNNTNTVNMDISNQTCDATIPGQTAGSFVQYKISAIDVLENGLKQLIRALLVLPCSFLFFFCFSSSILIIFAKPVVWAFFKAIKEIIFKPLPSKSPLWTIQKRSVRG